MSNLVRWHGGRGTPRGIIEEMWSMMEDLDRGLGRGPSQARRSEQRGTAALSPACDITETESAFVLSFDIPGLRREDIDIEVVGRQLKVSGTRKQEEEFKDKNTYRMERSFGSFHRSFDLPEGTKAEAIEAAYDNGVLRLSVPKVEAVKPHKVQIGEVGKGSFLKSLRARPEQKADEQQKLERAHGS